MLGFGATGEFAIGQVGAAAGAEVITPDKWLMALSEPVRFKNGVRASQQQFAAFPSPFPFVSFGWYAELSKPARPTRPSLNASEVPFFFFQPMPSPFVATGWFEPLAEPVRQRRGLPMSLYQFYAADPTVIPTTKVMPWFSSLSEPVRFKVGLRPSLQQFYAAPPRILPNPNLFGVLSALETKDTFLGGAVLFNRPTDAEIGVVNTTPQPAEIGISAAAPAAGVITVRISIIVG